MGGERPQDQGQPKAQQSCIAPPVSRKQPARPSLLPPAMSCAALQSRGLARLSRAQAATACGRRCRTLRPQCSTAAPAGGWQQQREAPSPALHLAAVVQRAAAALGAQRAAACDMLCRWVGLDERRQRQAGASPPPAACSCCCSLFQPPVAATRQHLLLIPACNTRLVRSSLDARQRLGSSLLLAAAVAAPVPGGGGAASIWADLMSNYVFCVGFCGWFTAQFLKIFTKRYKTGVWTARAFFDSGGMPSSHSALCSSVTTAIAIQQGLGSPLFAVAVCFRCAAGCAARHFLALLVLLQSHAVDGTLLPSARCPHTQPSPALDCPAA